jgi:hypothetical protein
LITPDTKLSGEPRSIKASAAVQQSPTKLTECIFVTGIMRSGTSLLQRVVAQSCATEYIREESSLHALVESFQVLDQYQAFHLLERSEYVAHYRQFISGVLAASKNKITGGILVLKDPLALKTLALFHELMPMTKFIISLRNPLATAASICRVRNRQRQQGKKTFISRMDFGDIVEYIARLCDIIISMRERDNVCVVQYEGLIGRDPVSLARLGDFIGAAVDLDLEDDTAAYNPEHAFWTPESGASIKCSSLDKHETELTPEERGLVLTKLARFNSMFGYAES